MLPGDHQGVHTKRQTTPHARSNTRSLTRRQMENTVYTKRNESLMRLINLDQYHMTRISGNHDKNTSRLLCPKSCVPTRTVLEQMKSTITFGICESCAYTILLPGYHPTYPPNPACRNFFFFFFYDLFVRAADVVWKHRVSKISLFRARSSLRKASILWVVLGRSL